jgi:hypothetical protein
MALRIPTFKEPGLTDFLVRMIQDRDRLLENTLTKITANQSLLLQSPLGKVYEVKVNDAGAITITQLSG